MEKSKLKSKSIIGIFLGILFLGSLWQEAELISLELQNVCKIMMEAVFLSHVDSGQPMQVQCLNQLYVWYENEVDPSIGYAKNRKGMDSNVLVKNTNLWEEGTVAEAKKEAKELETKDKNWLKKWRNPNYLRKYVYQVDSTTMVTNGEINGARLLSMDLSLPKERKPQILIYHTHGSEAYRDSKKGRKTDTVIGVGDTLTSALKKYGFKVLHDRNIYDVKHGKEDRSKAYSYASKAIEKNLKRYPSIQVIIDVHRDGVKESTKLVTTQNNKRMAQIMFFNGVSRSARNGDIKYLKNENKLKNLAFSLQLQAEAKKLYQGLTRKIYIKGYRYNLHYRGRSLLVEVGAQNNTVKEAKASMPLLAKILSEIL